MHSFLPLTERIIVFAEVSVSKPCTEKMIDYTNNKLAQMNL